VPKTLSPDEIEGFRERLCDVAERLFAQHGPEAVTVRQLASELGVSPMTPYRYFKDKDAMLAAVRARAFDRFAIAMEAARGSSRIDDDPGGPYVDFALGNPEAYKLMFDVNQPTFTAYPDLVQAMTRARATMSIGVATGVGGTARDGDIELISHVFWSALHGPIMLQLAGLLRPSLDARSIVRESLGALIRSYRAPA
jgi:AcrR family transcriptional regulator